MQHAHKPLLALVLSFVLVTSVTPVPAHAQLIVNDPINYLVNGITSASTLASKISDIAMKTKEFGLDPIIWQIRTLAIQSIQKSTLNWINSGFQGSPAYVTDLSERFRTVGDTVAADFLRELELDGSIDSPFRDVLVQGLRDEYYRSTGRGGFFQQNTYTFDSYSEDPEAFLSGRDFSKGGFNAWFAAQQPQNNPFTAYLSARNELAGRVEGAQENEKTQLNWSGGFRAYKGNCTATQTDAAKAQAQAAADAGVSLDNTDPCLSASVVTPGSVIRDQLSRVVGSGLDQYLSADEFDEIINALAGQLVKKVLGSGGLFSVSQPTSGGGSSYLDRASEPVRQTSSSGGETSGIFSQSVNEQRQQVQEFQSSWQKIQAAANSAQTCSTNPNVQTTVTTAGQRLAKAATALSALEKIGSDLITADAATGAAQNTQMQQVFDAYQSLYTSGALPSSDEMLEASEQSQDIPGTLYYQMKTACGASQ